jgi:hypothetical protein
MANRRWSRLAGDPKLPEATNAPSVSQTAKPGAMQLTVANAKAADDRKFDVVLQPSDGSDPEEETVTGGLTWARSPVSSGMHTITATATIGQKAAAASQVIDVKPSEVCEVSLTPMDQEGVTGSRTSGWCPTRYWPRTRLERRASIAAFCSRPFSSIPSCTGPVPRFTPTLTTPTLGGYIAAVPVISPV